MEQGLIQIYTGDGKGKTTAAVGLLIRATGQGLKCCLVSFFKDFERYTTGELSILKKIGVDIHSFVKRSPCFDPDVPFEEMRKDCLDVLEFVSNKLFSDERLDLLVLDEINNALRYEFITEQEMIDFMDKKPVTLELVLTGRGATDAVMKKADLVSNIEKVKHPYDNNILGRKGVEY